MKKSLSLLLAVIMLSMTFTALPVTANAVDVDTAATAVDKTFTIKTAEELTAAVSQINSATEPSNYVIELDADIVNGYISITNSDAVVTVYGNGHTIDGSQVREGIIYASNGATVSLGSSDGGEKNTLTIVGGINNDAPGIVYVLANSACNMYDGVTLKDHKGQNFYGGGVTIEGGTFHMYGGTIDNCGIDGGSISYGGGVAVIAGGTFIMDNGSITNCYAKSDYAYTWEDYYAFLEKGIYIDPQYTVTASGGGVFVAGGSSFIMNNGTISNNTVLNTDGGMAYGGGVAMMITLDERNNQNVLGTIGNPQSSVTINGGTITGNQAECGGGIYATGYYYTYYGPIGAAVPEDGTTMNPGLYINGGEISSNTATDAGGGIFASFLCPWNRANNNAWNGFKTQIHNATIKNNTADNGAGIESYGYWTQMDIDGCTITGNSAESYGGGIALIGNASSGLTRLKNSTVTGNTSGEIGAGVLYDSQSLLYISGADIIQDNTYNGKLNNLNVWDVDYPVYVNGDLTGSQIGLSDPDLWDDDLEDTDPNAASADHLTSGYRTYNPDVHPDQYFTSDHETWYVDRSQKITTTEPDTSSAYRVYTFERHPVVSISDNAPYAGNNGQYDISDILNTEVQSISSADSDDDFFNKVYSELSFRYTNNYGYTEADQSNQNTKKFRYSPPDNPNSAFTGIVIEQKLVNNPNKEITITYNSTPKLIDGKRRGGSVVYTASKAIQGQYPDSTKLVLKITSSSGDFSKYTFSDDSTEEKTVEYVDADLPSTGVLYEYDKETGDIVAKLIPIIDPSTQKSYVTEYAKTITTESGTDDEVRLNRKQTVDYHINNEDISSSDVYQGKDEFTEYVDGVTHNVSIGDPIEEFYLIPQHDTEYIFKGWYYDPKNDDDDRPVQFGTDKYIKGKDIYAHWIKVEDVAQDAEDTYELPAGYNGKYGGFDLAGVQIRDGIIDTNFGYEHKPGGMRFITSLSMDVVNEINAIKPNNIEYGYVAATHKDWIDYHAKGVNEKLQYVSTNTNGIDTKTYDQEKAVNYFGFAKNVNCTSRKNNTDKAVYKVNEDHRNYDGYLLYTLVITYEGADDAERDKNVLARPYIKYEDANGLTRVAYSDYRGNSVKIGGCYTNYNQIKEMAEGI